MAGFFKKQEAEKNNKPNEIVKDILLDNLPEGIIAADDTGEIIYCNQLGQEIINHGLFGPIDIVSRNSKEFEYMGRNFEARYTRIPQSTGIKGVIATLVDTIGTTQQANEIAELNHKLEKANGFKAAFLANMSHEIRTPIHAIIGFAELIMKKNISEDVKSQIDMIKDSSYSLLAIINDVLDLSKLESGRMELVCSNYYISYVIRDIEATYSLLASRKGLKFEMHLDDNIPSSMYGDKIRLRGALLNILNNAVKFTKEGHIDFSIHVLEKRDGIVTLQFIVKDTGIGIKREDIDRIFESFSKFDINNNYSVEGRGLGLSIAKGYMDLMGGTIAVKSEYGVGSTFTITVDQKIINDAPVDMKIVNARKKKDNEKFTIKNYKALVADDNPVNLTVADGLMKAYGINVDKAGGGREAVDMCMNTEYDIIFMDQMMPEVDGVMAMKEIRKISDFYANESKIIVLTADAMAGVRDRLMSEGFDEYLCKPLEIHRLESMFTKFVPEECFVYGDPKKDDIVIEQSNAVIKASHADFSEDIPSLAQYIGIPENVLKRKIKDCGGEFEDYRNICEISDKYVESRIQKLKESHSIKDYERYTIAVHALKSSLASLGEMNLSARAKEQEDAGKEGNYEFIDANMEALINDYEIFANKIRTYVLKKEADVADKLEAVSDKKEWSKEEISKVCRKITSLVEEFNFGEIYDLLADVKSMDMGPKTKQVFDDFDKIMNDMDIEGLKKKLGEFT